MRTMPYVARSLAYTLGIMRTVSEWRAFFCCSKTRALVAEQTRLMIAIFIYLARLQSS